MKIAFACDHKGFAIKGIIFEYLRGRGYEILDCGTDSEESMDYTDTVLDAAQKLADGECDFAIAVCYTGIGNSIAANKVKGVRASLVEDVERAKLTKEHNDSNMLVLAAGFLAEDRVVPILEAWFEASFEGGRHARRVDKIKEYENHRD